MSWTALILGYGFQTALFYLASTLIKRKDDVFKSLKLFLFLYALVNTFILGLIPFVITANPADVGSFKVVAISLFSINILMFLGFILLYGIGMLQRTFDLIMKLTRGK